MAPMMGLLEKGRPSAHLPHPSSYEGIEQGERNGEERVE